MICFDNVSFRYQSGGDAGLKNLNFSAKDGEFLVLCGRSGCGKTTVTRIINGLIPHFYEGEMSGNVTVNGICIGETPLSGTAAVIGSVFQNPRSQFFNVDTTGEVAFGCENQAMERKMIRERLEQTVRELELEALMGRSIFELSGGEKQQVACGSVYAASPDVYVLDEPSSNMDTRAILRLKKILKKLKEQGKTVIISEHRLYYLMDLADRFLYLEDGRLKHTFSAAEMKNLPEMLRKKLGLRTLSLESVTYMRDYTGEQFVRQKINHAGKDVDMRTEKRTGEVFSTGIENHAGAKFSGQRENNSCEGIALQDICCIRGKEEALRIPSLSIPAGTVTAVVGENGAGKSTLAEVLCGLIKSRGMISFQGRAVSPKQRTKRCYMVMQDVTRQLFCDSVEAEVMLGTPKEREKLADTLLEQMALSAYRDCHPASLSGGQKQRTAICAAVCAGKDVLIYDEPTSGLDYDGMDRLCRIIGERREENTATLIITHDLELVMGCCTHVLHLENGGVKEFYPLDETGTEKVKRYFIGKGGNKAMKKQEKKKSGLSRMLELAGEKKHLVIPSLILSILASIVSFVPHICIYFIILEVVKGYPVFDGDIGASIIRFGLLAFAGVAANVILYFCALVLSHLAAFGELYALKVNFTKYLAKLPLGFHLHYGSGRLRKITDENIEKVEGFIAHQLPDLAAALTAPVVMIILLLAVDWRYGVVSFVGVVIAFIVEMAAYGKDAQKNMNEYQSALEEMNNASVEYIRGITVVKAFRQTVYSFNRLHDSIKKYTKFVLPYTLGWRPFMSLYTTLVNNIYLFIIPVVIFIGMNTAQAGYADFASSTIFYLIFVPSISSVMMKVMYSSTNCMQISSCVERMDEVLQTSPLKETESPEHCEAGDVVFESVSFSYAGDKEVQALQNVSFRAKQGEVTAVVGPSGGGKSTIANLIPRFYDVDEGCISIGGVDIRNIRVEELMNLVSFVFQDVFLFKQSIKENIRMGRPDASDEEVIAAAKAAQCHEFIMALPKGYDTVYGRDGIYLSGGEQQRVAIARAIVKDSPILVLDEATAFADPENEHLIQKALNALMKDKTVIMIAHRLSTIRNADHILVMDNGKLAGQGTHETLLAEGGRYRHMWDTYTRTLTWKMEKEVNGNV